MLVRGAAETTIGPVGLSAADDLLAVPLERLERVVERVARDADAVPGHAERGQLVETGEVGVGVEGVPTRLAAGLGR